MDGGDSVLHLRVGTLVRWIGEMCFSDSGIFIWGEFGLHVP